MQGNLHGKRIQSWSQVHLQKKYIMLLEICSIFVIKNCIEYDCSVWLVSLRKDTLQVNKWVSVFCLTLVFLIHYCSITKNFHIFTFIIIFQMNISLSPMVLKQPHHYICNTYSLATGNLIWQKVPIHIMRYTIHIHWSGKGCRKSNNGNLHSFGSPQFISASAKPLSSGISKTIIKPEIILERYTNFKNTQVELVRQSECHQQLNCNSAHCSNRPVAGRRVHLQFCTLQAPSNWSVLTFLARLTW